ncbi:type I restriction enzyme S subunit [Nesterenkonia lacusekhoensis]|uniref:Type I restriction enzyme S subunit n=2 Tax=Nesterenkonia lacusekhoensis TaxID=150832 RepID=A0ABS4T246_9MICC|nr:type I restriction enzyme S subunit [Nesterenkonia lacusekhoensis]
MTIPFGRLVTRLDKRAGGKADYRPLLSVSQTHGVVRFSELHDGEPRAESLENYKLVETDDIVLNRMSVRAGAVGIACEPGLVTPDYEALRVNDGADPRFIKYLMKSSWFISEMVRRERGIGAGGGQGVRTSRISFADMRVIPVERFPLDVQRAIADYLDHETAEIDAFIADQEQMMRLIDEHWKSSLIEQIQRGGSQEELRETGLETWPQAPAAWSEERLKASVLSHKNGAWGADPSEDDQTVRCIRVADFDKKHGRIHSRSATDRSYATDVVQREGLRHGDLLIEKSGGGPSSPVGNVVLYEGEGEEMYSNFTARIVTPNWVDSLYALYLHKSLYLSGVTSRSVKQSTGIQNLDMGMYLDERVYLPPFDQQRKIAAQIEAERESLDRLTKDAQVALELARERKSALISATVTGQLEVDRERGAGQLGSEGQEAK